MTDPDLDAELAAAARAVRQASTTAPAPTAVDARRAAHRRRLTGVAGAAALVALVVGTAALTRAGDGEPLVAVGSAGPSPWDTAPGGSSPVDTAPTDTSPNDTAPDTVPPEPVPAGPEPDVPAPPPTTPPVPQPSSPVVEVRLTGRYEGTSTYAFGARGCIDQDHHVELDVRFADGASARYTADVCAEVRGDVWDGRGPFALAWADGSGGLTGTVISVATLPTDGVPYRLEVEGGTGRFDGLTGECAVTLSLTEPELGRQIQRGTIDCTLS